MGVGRIILIVVLILLGGVALVVGVVAFVVVPEFKEAQRPWMDARTMLPAAEKYRYDHPDDPCPTVELLREKRELSRAAAIVDQWGSPYEIVCNGDDVIVVSFGPDKRRGTDDDIRTPETK
jgi:general secretion pathway protein G